MLKRVYAFIEKHRLMSSGQHVLVAVSGGADSVALLLALRELAPSLAISLTVAHLDHRIRAGAAEADATFVKTLAAQWRIAFVGGRADVPARSRRRGVSLEMAARQARYEFLARVARQTGADLAATAHTADDQAETVLLKLTRGAGPQGLGGIQREVTLRGLKIVRPMLDVSRKEITAFLLRNKCSWREDDSNRNVSFLRNRVRHEIMPLLGRRLNPKIAYALRRAAEVMSEENRWLDSLCRPMLGACAHSAGGLDVQTLKQYPLAARRRILRLWLVACGASAKDIDFESIDRMELLLQRRKGTGSVDIAGGRTVHRCYGQLLAKEQRAGKLAKDSGTTWSGKAVIKVPGETVLTERGLRVVVTLAPGVVKAKRTRPGLLPARATIGREAVGKRKLYVRARRAGDRIEPLGMKGSKKLQDIFVDEKVPVDQRAQIPLFECGGQIVWLPGHCVARGWEVGSPSAVALQLRVERI